MIDENGFVKCDFCGATLPPKVTLCPFCGRDLGEKDAVVEDLTPATSSTEQTVPPSVNTSVSVTERDAQISSSSASAVPDIAQVKEELVAGVPENYTTPWEGEKFQWNYKRLTKEHITKIERGVKRGTYIIYRKNSKIEFTYMLAHLKDLEYAIGVVECTAPEDDKFSAYPLEDILKALEKNKSKIDRLYGEMALNEGEKLISSLLAAEESSLWWPEDEGKYTLNTAELASCGVTFLGKAVESGNGVYGFTIAGEQHEVAVSTCCLLQWFVKNSGE